MPAQAQLALSPLSIEEQATRGRAQSVITLTNTSDQPMRVRLYSEPFTFDREGFVSLEEDVNDLSPYLQFSPREVVIQPGYEQRVRLLSLFPPSLPSGEYKTAVFAEELIENNGEAESVAIAVRIASTVYMRQGDVQPLLSGERVQPNLDQQGLTLLVANQGEATARTTVRWQLLTEDAVVGQLKDGDIVAEGTEPIRTVIAGGDRNFPLPLSSPIESGRYKLVGEFNWMSTDGQMKSEPLELPVLIP